MAGRLRKVPKVKNPDLSSIARSMAKDLEKQADIEEPSIMSEVSKYASVLRFDGGSERGTTKFY